MEEVEAAKKKQVDPRSGRFPNCVVWTPLPVVSWLAPFVGHVGICREDGVILDFAGPYFVNVDNFAFGSPARYVRLSVDQCTFPPPPSALFNPVVSWDDAIRSSMQTFQHKTYNFFTCNCHSFVANCLNSLGYQGSDKWNVVKVLFLVHTRGQWVNFMGIVRSLLPFVFVMLLGIYFLGWSFIAVWAAIASLLMAWFIVATYCINGYIHC